MLETYFAKPETVERIRASWIGSEVERYVGWLAGQGYGARTVWRRVPRVVAFGEFARQRGAKVVGDLPTHVDAYVTERVSEHRGERKNGSTARQVAKEARAPVEQTEPVNPGETGRLKNYGAGETSTGLLIQAGPGNDGGTGAWRTKRSG